VIARNRAGAAQDRRNVSRARDLFRQGHWRKALAPLREALFRQRDESDHSLIGFARGFADAENPMLEQYESFDISVAVENIGDALRQRKTGNGVRHVCNSGAEYVTRYALAVRLIGQCQYRRRMRVIDVFVRQE